MRKQDIHNEEILLKDFREGREKAFTDLYMALYPGLYLFAVKITADQPTAQDIVEESFIKIWDRRLLFHHFSGLKSYLYTTARNASLSWLESNARRLQTERESETQRAAAEHHTVLEKLIRAETMQIILSELDKLPPRSRQVFIMFFIDGKKPREIAKELKISINTVKAHRFQSLAILQKKNLRRLL